MKYNVFLCPELRVKLVNIEADSQLDAIHKAEEIFGKTVVDGLRNLMNRNYPDDGEQGNNDLAYIELSEDCHNSLVDEVGDTQYANSTWYNCEDKPEWTPRFPAEKKAKRKKKSRK